MKTIWHEKGCKDMEGWEALDYARQRYGLKNGDYDRQRHQQQLIKAIAKKASGSGVLTNPIKVNSLIKSAGKAFVLDTGGVPVADFLRRQRPGPGDADRREPGDVQRGARGPARQLHPQQPRCRGEGKVSLTLEMCSDHRYQA